MAASVSSRTDGTSFHPFRVNQGQSVAITCAMAASVSSRTDGTSFHPFEPSATRHAPSGASIGRSAAVRPVGKGRGAVVSTCMQGSGCSAVESRRSDLMRKSLAHCRSVRSHHKTNGHLPCRCTTIARTRLHAETRRHSEALRGGHQRHSEVIRDTQRHSSEALRGTPQRHSRGG